MDLREKVFEALDHALENGFSDVAFQWSLMEVAIDIVTHDADLDELDPHELIEYVLEWRSAKLDTSY